MAWFRAGLVAVFSLNHMPAGTLAKLQKSQGSVALQLNMLVLAVWHSLQVLGILPALNKCQYYIVFPANIADF
jgi:hypothetical protein